MHSPQDFWNSSKAPNISLSPPNRRGIADSSRQPKSCSTPRCSSISRCHTIDIAGAFAGWAAARSATVSDDVSMAPAFRRNRSATSRGSSPPPKSSPPAGAKRRSAVGPTSGRLASTRASRGARSFSSSSLRCAARGALPVPSSNRAGIPPTARMPKSCSRPRCSRYSRWARTSATVGCCPLFAADASSARVSSDAIHSAMPSTTKARSSAATSPSRWRAAAGGNLRFSISGLARSAERWTAPWTARWHAAWKAWMLACSPLSFATLGPFSCRQPSRRSIPLHSMSSSCDWSSSRDAAGTPPLSRAAETSVLVSSAPTIALARAAKDRSSSAPTSPDVWSGRPGAKRRFPGARGGGRPYFL
mmetsp:Transcript_26692/g.56764  ORF Transcript_26692/g.56764 Transcript_26692/m.56764 type:complete len:361 (+) Transcript_26692:281-1363(+)